MIRIILWRFIFELLNFAKAVGWRGPDRFYFAYGANLDPEVMRKRGMTVKGSVLAQAPDFTLKFNHEIPFEGIGMASIERETGSVVHGLVHTIPAVDEWIMDCHEGCMIFRRYRKGTIEISGRDCFYYYTANPTPNLLPPKAYLTKLLNGYRTMFEPESSFIAKLEGHPSLPEMIPRNPPKFLFSDYDKWGPFLRPVLETYDSVCVKVFVFLIFRPSIFKRWL